MRHGLRPGAALRGAGAGSVAGLRRAMLPLEVPNFRRYAAGQLVSVSGNWVQNTAALWLMVVLTGSGVSVGLTAAMQFLPLLLLGPWGGLLADRVDKRRLLMVTQTLLALPAITLCVLVATGAIQPWMVLALTFVRGAVTAVDNPARQAFPMEMVGGDRLVGAVALNSVMIQSGRIVGPAIAGGLIATVGIAWAFALDALSFVAMLVALRRMRPAELLPVERAPRARGDLRAGVRHVMRTPGLRVPLLMMALIGTLAFNFPTVLALMASETWNAGSGTFALLMMSLAVGSVGGALAAGARGTVSSRLLVGAALAFGVLQLVAAAAPSLPLQVAALVVLGTATVTFSAGVSSALQLRADPRMRGRVMSLFSIVFLGSTPLGAPLLGWISESAGARWGLALGGLAALLAAALGALAGGDERRAPAAVAPDGSGPGTPALRDAAAMPSDPPSGLVVAPAPRPRVVR